MNLLLTNDDGVASPGILLFADALRKAGHRVHTLAPASDQSGVSHAITYFKKPCKIAAAGEDTWSCEGTPVDCVMLALMGALPEMQSPPDMVLSGINRGANLGTDIVYSGTAAAARQGAISGIPSAAFSLVEEGGGKEWHWETAINFIIEHLAEIAAYWKPQIFVNVNLPNTKEKPLGLLHSFPCFRYYDDTLDIYEGPGSRQYHCFVKTGKSGSTGGGVKPEKDAFKGLSGDYEAVMQNYASISDVLVHPVLHGSVY